MLVCAPAARGGVKVDVTPLATVVPVAPVVLAVAPDVRRAAGAPDARRGAEEAATLDAPDRVSYRAVGTAHQRVLAPALGRVPQ